MIGRFLAAVAALSLLPASGALAEEVTLQGVSCFPQGSFFSKRFEGFVDAVNEEGKGVVQINYVGGAPAIGSPFTLMQKVAQGVYDIASCTGAYYQNVVPEADAWKLQERTPSEVRANGGWDAMVQIHRKAGLMPLARTHWGTRFHLFLGKDHKVEGPDLSGLHLRVAPIYTSFFTTLGATTQTSDLASIFTLMENGTVVGYGWPVLGHQPGWEQVTAYRVDPGFYDVDLEIQANVAVWDALSDDAKLILERAAKKIEEDSEKNDISLSENAGKKQAEEGMEIITFEGEDRDTWLGTARDSGWAGVAEIAPDSVETLRPLFSKK